MGFLDVRMDCRLKVNWSGVAMVKKLTQNESCGRQSWLRVKSYLHRHDVFKLGDSEIFWLHCGGSSNLKLKKWTLNVRI